MNSTRTKLLRIAGGLGVVLLGSIRCNVALDPQPLQRFETCEDLELFLQDQILHPGVEESFEQGGVLVGCEFSAPAEDLAGVGEGEGELGRQFTTTNTQEVDVDEPDFVKNNGDVIFVLRRGEMIITRAWPAEDAEILSRTTVGGTPFTMLFNDDPAGDNDRALVISSFNTQTAHVIARLYDVSDPTLPIELRSVTIEGTFVDARAVDDDVLLVTHSQLLVDRSILTTEPFSDDENRERLRAIGLQRMLPQVSDFIVGRDTAPRVDKAIACENTYAPSRTDGRNILLVHGLSLSDETRALTSTGVVTQFSHVYGSLSSLYLASTETSDGGYFTPSFAMTRLHKLDAFTGDGAAEYQATGILTGRIKDELSLDEGPDGTLRIVVTDDSQAQDFGATQTTSLVVLEQDGTDLNEVSRVDDIGRGENVESVRFLGEKAYVVTYPVDQFLFIDQTGLPRIPFTDPLFVIDLADPRTPRLRGELEVDGYSAYIHPIDEDHLVTVGVNTNPDDGTLESLSIIVFDVSDPDAPAVLDRHDFGNGNTGSEALVERHAFTYFASQKALAIPVQGFANDGLMVSSGLAVFRIDPTEENPIEPYGLIEQAPLYESIEGGNVVDIFTGPCASVRRSVMISERNDAFVYAISSAGITIASIEPELPTVKSLRFATLDEEVCDFSGSPL